MLLCFYERLSLVSGFTNRKKLEDNFCFYKNVYEYEDLDGNIGISDNCTYYKDYGYLSQSDNQVCYIDGVKTLVKTIKIYGAKKCNIWDGICEAKIYTELDVLN